MPDNKLNLFEQSSQSVVVRRRRLTVVIAIAVVVILTLFSAFVWPHWATKSGVSSQVAPESGGSAHPSRPATKPTIKAQPLPQGATDLMKAMPDTVGSHVRINLESAGDWTASSPLEEYSMSYSTGAATKDVTLHVAQWSQDDDANKQYSSLLSSLAGKELASGKVKVSSKESGSYVEKTDTADTKKAIILWRNATVVFRLEGPTAAVESFYKDFPL